MRSVVEFVQGVRERLGLEGRFGTAEDLLRALEHLDSVRVRFDDVRHGRCRHRDDGSATITLPCHLHGVALHMELSHEGGHAALTDALGAFLLQAGIHDDRIAKLARLVWGRNERIARVFMLEWLLPREMMAQFTNTELMALTDLPLSFIQERRRQLVEEEYQAEFALQMDLLMGRVPVNGKEYERG